MDLNRKYFDHQLAVMSAASAACEGERAKHQADADAISRCITLFQESVGALAAVGWKLGFAGRTA